MPFDIGGFVYNTAFIQDYAKGGIVTDGLVLHLDAAYGNSYPKGGTTWYDLSGNSNNGTLTNGPTYNSGNGGYISFDGSNDYISGTNTASLQLTSDLTVCAWVKLGDNANQGIFEKMTLSNYNGFGITKQSGYFKFWTASNNTTTYTVSNSTYTNDNNWYYVVGRRENGVNRLFINAVLQNDSQSPPLSDSGDVYVIGRYYSNVNGYYLGGDISNVQVYNRALSSTEISQNYNAQKDRFIYQPLTFSTSGNTTLVTNSNGSLTIYKGAGSDAWDSQGYSNQSFTAPCTLEFYKISEAADNGRAYAMIGWNVDPTANASYTNIDIAVYPYRFNTLRLYSNGSNLGDVGSWDITKKFYMSYDTDGYVRIWNGSNLLYTYNYGTGKTVYVDSSLNRVHPIYSRFSEIRVVNASWNGSNYER
jgi:hypothetical protein